MNTAYRLRYVGILLVGVTILGTAGYMAIEGWNLLDSLYMTIITISTVGYQEVRPLSDGGRAFSIALIIIGVGATFYGLMVFFELLVEGHIRGLLGRRRIEKGLRRMKDHYIVCGYGRVGRQVVTELYRRGKMVVVIDRDPARQDELADQNIINIPGDATDDKILIGSGVKTALGLVIALPHDADNVLITITARQLNPQLSIVARADEDRTRKKLLLAGATTVVCPHEIGGLRMAIATVSPNVVDFMQIAGAEGESGTQIEEIQVEAGSRLCGKTLRESPIRSDLGLTVIGLRKHRGAMRFSPGADEILECGDILIVIGPIDKLGTLRELTAIPPGAVSG
jgi:voltage-gated potassium channel